MKTTRLVMAAVICLVSFNLFAQAEKTDSIKVYGNCGMCKNRIEKALKIEGVSSASWDADEQLLVVKYDPSKTSNDVIQKKVAAVGHDTEKYTAPDAVYNKLHGCCKYERKKTE